MIESVIILAGAGVLALVLVVGLLARRPAHVPVTVRIRSKELALPQLHQREYGVAAADNCVT